MSAACAVEALPALDELRPAAAELFREAVRLALASPGFERPKPYAQMVALIADQEAYGFDCWADAIAALVPRADTLTWFAYSKETIDVRGFRITVKTRPFHIAGHCVHVEVQSVDRTPLPFTSTGYQSLFVNFATAADYPTPRSMVEELFPADPIQVGLF
ncbi:hypothetical protein [Dyella ginsengisoli]|uniref:hypothetical protein n=1 Tax=Dyella ginsengisoli TaxID=363848 RepID=UPI00037CC061|nr:hypothetical protein [Dyella ginsengisoli]